MDDYRSSRRIVEKTMTVFLSRSHTDINKGIAIFFVIITHLSATMLPSSIARFTTPLGGIAVAIFLFLSGYGTNESFKIKGYDKFFKKKVACFVLPYLIVFVLFVSLMHNTLTFMDGVKFFFTIKKRSDYYYWYIGYQFICYVVFYLSVRFTDDVFIKYTVLTVLVTGSLLLPDALWAEQALSFTLGVATSDFICLKTKMKNSKTMLLLLLLGLLMLTLKQLPLVRNSFYLLFNLIQLLTKLPLALFILDITYVCQLESQNKAYTRIITFLGRNSYEIYLSHAIAILVFQFVHPLFESLLLFLIVTVILSGLLSSYRHKILQVIMKNN